MEDLTTTPQVMVATSGSQLLPPDAVTNLRQNLLPLTTILTPNIPEAKLLLTNAGIQVPDISSISDIVCIASLLQGLGSKHVLVKGGHLPLNTQLFPAQNPKDRKFVIDVLHSGTENDVVVFRTEYSETGNTHGTGCSLACMCFLPVISSLLSYRYIHTFFPPRKRINWFKGYIFFRG